jgi:hypothetical protein
LDPREKDIKLEEVIENYEMSVVIYAVHQILLGP